MKDLTRMITFNHIIKSYYHLPEEGEKMFLKVMITVGTVSDATLERLI